MIRIPSGSPIPSGSISPLRARARRGRRGQNPATAFQPIQAADLHGDVCAVSKATARLDLHVLVFVREGWFPWKRSYLCARGSLPVKWSGRKAARSSRMCRKILKRREKKKDGVWERSLNVRLTGCWSAGCVFEDTGGTESPLASAGNVNMLSSLCLGKINEPHVYPSFKGTQYAIIRHSSFFETQHKHTQSLTNFLV